MNKDVIVCIDEEESRIGVVNGDSVEALTEEAEELLVASELFDEEDDDPIMWTDGGNGVITGQTGDYMTIRLEDHR